MQNEICAEKSITKVETLDTPLLIVDLEKVERNIAKMMSQFASGKVSVRPHLKTVKSPWFAGMLLDAGCRGVCVAKLSEAEVMAEAGIEDILITTEIAGSAKLKRLMNLLSQHPRVKIVVDSKDGVDAIARAAKSAGVNSIEVLIEINVGQDRCGVEPGEPAVELARHVKSIDGLKLIGIQGYEGHVQLLKSDDERKRLNQAAMERLGATVAALKSAGIEPGVVTTGGTGSCALCAEYDFVTEVQPGSFVFMDAAYRNAINGRYENALEVMATVISKPSRNRVVIDAGLKSLSTDMGNAEVSSPAGLSYEPAGDEHGNVTAATDIALQVGDVIRLTPSHIDTTVNLHDCCYCHRNGVVEMVVPIAARGKVQ